MTNYLTHFPTRGTPQFQAIPCTTQVANNTGSVLDVVGFDTATLHPNADGVRGLELPAEPGEALDEAA